MSAIRTRAVIKIKAAEINRSAGQAVSRINELARVLRAGALSLQQIAAVHSSGISAADSCLRHVSCYVDTAPHRYLTALSCESLPKFSILG